MSKEVGEMVRSRDVVQAEGSARTEGARRATGVPADGAAAGAGSLLRLEDGSGGNTLLRKSGATLNDRTFEWFAMAGMAIHGLQLTENTALNAETSTSDGTATLVINVAYEVR